MTRPVTIAVLVGTLGAAPLGQGPAPPASQPLPLVFRTEVNYVEVDAFVTDAQGRAITNLKPEEVEVREDGTLQAITAFSRLDIPIERAAAVSRGTVAAGVAEGTAGNTTEIVDVDVQTNERGEGRIYLIVLDDLNTAFARAPRAKAAVRRFIEEQFGTNDLAAVVFTGRSTDNQDFTNNQRLLLAAVDTFTGNKLQSETEARLERAQVLIPSTPLVTPGGQTIQVSSLVDNGAPGELDPFEAERGSRARSTMGTIRRMADFMAGVRGRRKAMLLVGEGIDFNIEQTVADEGTDDFAVSRNARVAASAAAVRSEAHDAIAAATRGNVNIYALDPRGLPAGGDEVLGPNQGRSILSAREARAVLAGGSVDDLPDSRPGKRTIADEIRRAQDSLRSLAENTGGFAAVNQNDLSAAFTRIVEENSSYYMLGYSSANPRREGRYRKLEVRVKRPGVRVRARAGYHEARGRASERPSMFADAAAHASLGVAAALSSPLPVASLPFRVFAAPFRGEAPNASVVITVEIDGKVMGFVPQAPDTSGGVAKVEQQLEIVSAATNAEGQTFRQVKPYVVPLEMEAKAYEETTRGGGLGVRAMSELSLPPGRYQLRVAAGNGAGRAGSVVYDLDVPDFWKPPLALSGVALTSSTEGRMIDVGGEAMAFLPGLPTAVRTFARGDTIVAFAELYENVTAATPRTIDLRAELRSEDGRAVLTVDEERSSEDVLELDAGYGFSPRLVLADVPPGFYIVHIAGAVRGTGARASRNVQIRVAGTGNSTPGTGSPR